MCELLQLDNPASWPYDLNNYLARKFSVFLDWEQDNPSKNAHEYDTAINGLWEVISSYSITGWHCTRLTEGEIEAIRQDGMGLPSFEVLKRRVNTLERDGLLTSQVKNRLLLENQADETNRAGLIWFCFFPPRRAGKNGISRFFRHWGGEALYNSHEDNSEIGDTLKAIGNPCIIEADVPIKMLPEAGGLTLNIVRRYFVSHGFETVEPVDHKDRSKYPLPAENVRRVLRYPDPEFIELTGCDSWGQKPF